MAELNKMYKGVVNSPSTYLREPLASGGSIIYVIDGSVLGELPNLVVIGNDQTAETVLVKNVRSDGGYDVDRAVEGSAKDWPQMTTVARNFTNYDYEQIRQNFEILNNTKVDKVSGKQLSTNDYTTTEKNKLAGIQAGAQVNAVTSVQGRTGAVTVSKSDVGLSNVDNLSATSIRSGTTKADVGLSNVDNVKQMPISGGILENYREKLVTVAASGGSINLSLGNVFQHTPSGNITYSITNAVNSQAHSFTLIINMGSTVRTLTFTASVKWQGGEIPDMSEENKVYLLTFVSTNGGSNWLGMFGGEF